MFRFMTIIKAVADSNRVRILCALEGEELCVCQIVEMLGLAPSTVSKHLSILRQASLLEDRKDGRWMYYRQPDRPDVLTKKVVRLLRDSLSEDDQVAEDRRRVGGILCVEKEDLSREQAKRR